MEHKRKYDGWTVITLCVMGFYLLFMIYPLFHLFASSVIDGDTGGFSLKYFVKFFSKKYYLNTVVRSFKVTVCVTLSTILVATPLAYLICTVKIKGAGIIRVLILISSMSAPFIGAYSWILLLGRSGSITAFFKNTLHIQIPDIYGFHGIVFVLTLQLVPLVFTYMYGAMQNIDNSLMEASESMGCIGIKKMTGITLPLVLPTMLAAGVLVFMRALSDFGTPMLVGEGYKTIPVLIYSEYMGEIGGEKGFAAAISVMVTVLALSIFLLQKLFANRLSYSMNALHPIEPKTLVGFKNLLAHGFVYFYMVIALLPQASILVTSFRNSSGGVFQEGYSLMNYQNAVGKMGTAIQNTARFAGISIVIIIIIAVLISYATVRRPNAVTNTLDIITMIPYIVPGSILGISLATSFNNRPLLLTGTVVIMIVAFTVKRLPYTIRSSSAILHNISESVEEASLSLGASAAKTFFMVTVPMIAAGILSGALMSFLTILTELSSSIMLYTGKTQTMTVAIYTEVIRGNYGVASALSVMLSACTIVTILAVFKITGKKELSM